MYRLRKKIKGFTLVESIIAIGMASALIILVMKLTSAIRGDVVKGTVDLQNLQDARLVINSLRRDFTCAMPYYDPSDKQEDIDSVRNNPVLYTILLCMNLCEFSSAISACKPVMRRFCIS